MATHDYVIANGTGAAVRSDLNNALAAIVSNNSGSSEPGTTYAYQWWADTNANVLKIRNSSNDGWITLRELDGTMLIEDGSASAPGLAFAGDTDTGIAKNGTNGLMVTAGGVQRFSVSATEVNVNDTGASTDFRVESDTNTAMLIVDGSANRVGIGAATPAATLDVAGNQIFTAANPQIQFNDGGPIIRLPAANTLAFLTDSTNERARIEPSGRLLVGTSSALTTDGGCLFQVASASAGNICLGRNDTTTVAGENLGAVRWYGNDSNGTYEMGAMIEAVADLDHGTGDKPTRLAFSTTADGASSPTERLRISRNGAVGIGTTSASNRLRIHEGSDTPNVVIVTGADESSEFLALGIDGGLPAVTAGGVSSTSASLGFRVSDNGTESEAARFDKDGRLLVGTSSVIDSNSTVESYKASGQNHVRCQSNSLANGQYSMFRAHGNTSGGGTRQAYLGVYKHSGIVNPGPFLFLEAEDGSNIYFWSDNSGNFRTSGSPAHIGTTSGTVVGTQTSDLRLKNVGANVGYGLAEVKQLQPKQYALKKDPDVNRLGFIAQEVESIIPEAVFDTNEELDGHQEGDRTKLGMEYVQLIPVLVNAIKELSAEVDTLKTKVAALEAG